MYLIYFYQNRNSKMLSNDGGVCPAPLGLDQDLHGAGDSGFIGSSEMKTWGQCYKTFLSVIYGFS